MQNRPLAVVLVLTAATLSACQHVPPQPLHLDAVRVELTERLRHLDAIEAYAESESNPSSTPFDVDDGLTLDEATLVALWYNAEARFAREEVEHALARLELAGQITDPELNLGVGQKQVDVGNRIDKSLILESGLKITIPISGRRAATRTLRASEYKLALLEAEEVEWDAATRLREAWYQWSASVDSVELLENHLDWVTSVASLTKELAQAGELNIVEARFFEIEQSRLTSALIRARGDQETKRLQCLRIMGLHPEAEVKLLPEPGFPIDSMPPVELASAHPTLSALQTEYQVAEDALQLEIRKQFPDLTISPGITDEENETSIRLGLGIPLPVWDANRLGIAEAIAHRHDVRIHVENEVHRLTADLAVSLQRAKRASAQRDHLAKETLPMLRDQIRQAEILLGAGELDITLLNGLLNQSITLKQELIDAHLEEQMALSAIRAATEPFAYSSVFEWENSQ